MFAGSCMNKTIKFDIVGEVPVIAGEQSHHLEQSREVTRNSTFTRGSLLFAVKAERVSRQEPITLITLYCAEKEAIGCLKRPAWRCLLW